MLRITLLITALFLTISLHITDLSSIQDSMRITSLENDVELCEGLIAFYEHDADHLAVKVVNDMRRRKTSKLLMINNLRNGN